MITLRSMTTAYLQNENDFLLMKRAANRKFAPGIWAGVGGHIEKEEINQPGDACLREIYEETGIPAEMIDDLQLRYIILRRSKDEIRLQYVYFAKTTTRQVIYTDEGELFWIPKDKLLDRELSATTKETLRHYSQLGEKMSDVLVGTVSAEKNIPIVNWSPVQDWEGMI